MKKKLVFHLYVGSELGGGLQNEGIRIHLSCLNHYSHLFDEAVIVISTDTIEDISFLSYVKQTLVRIINIPSITLKIEKNSFFREAKTFYDEVVNKDFDGITFFAHSKGYSNFSNPSFNHDYIVDWILGLYWLSLRFTNEAEASLSLSTEGRNSYFFGSFPMIEDDGSIFLPSVYSGTFFWVNMRLLQNEFRIYGRTMPSLSSRMSAEEFPGLCYLQSGLYGASHDGWRIFQSNFDMYGKGGGEGPFEAISFLCHDDGLFEEYKVFKKTILSTQ